ncbi:MAG: SGNH/GDSL hydrolase family protein [Chitinophagales bacterium]
MASKRYTLLCLGDSYTIGESVAEKDRFPEKTVELLYEKGIEFNQPDIIAKTGWTTDELASVIKERNLKGPYSFVTLLIGVNNQYRQRNLNNYRKEFAELLHTAIDYAGGNKNHVVVISIPDWGVTPFVAQDAKQRTGEQIGREIDEFNAVNKEEAAKAGVHYIDITAHSRLAAKDEALIANDGLHPSGKMYLHWASELSKLITNILSH